MSIGVKLADPVRKYQASSLPLTPNEMVKVDISLPLL
jgi:hypothetical protein